MLTEAVQSDMLALPEFVAMMKERQDVPRVPRTAVFLCADTGLTPYALLHNLKRNRVLHERNVVLSVRFTDEPIVAPAERLSVRSLGEGFWQVEARFGFMQAPSVPQALALAGPLGLDIDAFQTSYFLSRETVVPRASRRMAGWRQNLFETLSRNAGWAVEFFDIPPNSVIELGTRLHL